MAVPALALGAHGYLEKGADFQQIRDAVHEAAQGTAQSRDSPARGAVISPAPHAPRARR